MSTEGRGGFAPLPRVLLILACFAVRLVALDSDPPSWLSWSTGLYTDEGFYTLDARHLALFGTPAPGNFHDRLLSPLLSVLQQGVFSVSGTGTLPARLIGVSFGLGTVGVFWLGLRRAYGVTVADFGALFLGLAPVFALYNRTALQETPTVFWLTLAFTLWAYGVSEEGNRGAVLRGLGGLSAAVGIVFKGLAVIAVGAGFPPAPNNGGAGKSSAGGSYSGSPIIGGGGGLLLGLALYGLLWYAPHHAELTRMGTYYRVHQIQPHSWHSLGMNVRRGLIGGERGVVPFLLASLPVPCLLAVWALMRRRTPADRYLTLWLACGLLFCLLSSYAPSRYYVLFLPPLAGLAGRGLVELKRPVQAAAWLLFLLTSLAWYGASWAERSYAGRDAGRELARTLPPGNVVIGDFAPALCRDTRFAATTVQPGLANDDHPVERLRATHVVVVRNAKSWQNWWRARYPNVVQPSHRVATFDLGGSRHYVVDVYAVKEGR